MQSIVSKIEYDDNTIRHRIRGWNLSTILQLTAILVDCQGLSRSILLKAHIL